MPKFYPERDCNFYIERLVDKYHNPRLHILRKKPLKNQIRWFREPTCKDINRSVIHSWGIGDEYKRNTGFKCCSFLKSRLRRKCKLPIAGCQGMWKITRVGTAGMCRLPLHDWDLKEWLRCGCNKGRN